MLETSPTEINMIMIKCWKYFMVMTSKINFRNAVARKIIDIRFLVEVGYD